VLVDALRLAPSHLGILVELGDVYLGLGDWPRAQQVIETMQRMDDQEATDLANELNARFLQAQDKTTEAVIFLEGLVADGSAGFEANVAIVRAHLDSGDYESARNYVNTLLADDPDNTGVQFMDAAVDAATGNVVEAENTYRRLLEQDDSQIQVWIALFRLMASQDESEKAATVLEEAQVALPEDGTLKWIKAGLLEQAGDITGAIEIYEDLYALDSDNLIVANNLASLMTGTGTDADTIEDAYRIAKRLRLSPVPPYQDTYGWIAYLRGDYEEAVKSLEPAAAALSEDPLVQYHLATVYVALEQNEEAIIQFQKVTELTGAADTRDFVGKSRTEIARLLKEQEVTDKE
jgi:tetratricopeptide (TPR) repeat protein